MHFSMDILNNCGTKSREKRELYLFQTPIESFENLLATRQNIHTLVIIGQYGIASFNAISELMQLEELWIVESGIQEVPCFQKNCQLKKLYLYSNELTRIPNLEVCSRLTVLYLSGNKIHNFENLNKLSWLQELNLANNKIERISKVSLKKFQLYYLNLAGNQLSFIRDVKNLSQFQNLSSLVFADPLYGDCPLITLCNYRAYTIYHLTQLKRLDHYSICEKERYCTNRFFKKQITCYNVVLHKQLSEYFMLLKRTYEEYLQKVHSTKSQLYATKMKRNKAHDEFQNTLSKIELSKKQFIEEKEMAIIQSKILQQQLIINMKYCGNINFVEYNANSEHTIIQLCKQFLEESLCSMIKHGIGISSLKLHKVTKIYNKQIDQFTALKNENLQSDVCNVILKILVSFGVSDIKKWPFNFFKTDLFTEEEVMITNCLGVADAEWLNKVFSMDNKEITLKSLSICERRRVCILIQAPILHSIEKIDNTSDFLHTKYANYSNNSDEMCQKYKLIRTDIKNPLFVVEYEYVMKKEDEHKNFITECALNDGLCIHLTKSNILQCVNVNEQVEVYNLMKICLSGQNISSIDIDLVLPNLKVLDVSFNKLENFPNSNILKYIKILNVNFNNIQFVHIENTLAVLEELYIAWNCLMMCIRNIEEFTNFLPNICKLNICNNPFQDVIDPELVKYLMHVYIPKLKFVNNCACENLSLPKNYFPCVFNMCELNNKRQSRLIYLKQTASKNSEVSVMEKKNMQYAKFIHVSQHPFHVSDVLKKAPKMQELCSTNCLLTTFPIVKSLKYLIKLNLGSNFISSLDNFSQENFPVLKYLDLTNNQITALNKMGTFRTLQEFYCGNNDIRNLTQIDNIKTWQMLCVIDFSNNPITINMLYKNFIIYHLSNIRYISGDCIQNKDISEARYVFGNKLDKHLLHSVYKTERLANITQLSLVNCSLSKVDLSAEFLPQLESLDLSKNQITYLWGLHSFEYLRTLCLSYNCLEAFYENVNERKKCVLPRLCNLFLNHNCIKNLININNENMPVIKHLFLNNNCLCNVNEINYCSTLESLFLDNNQIGIINVEDIKKSYNLKTLSFENNNLKSLEFIRPLQKLKKLYAANNCLSNLAEIQNLLLLKNLEELTLEGNPVCKMIDINNVIAEDFELKNMEDEEI